MVLGAISLFVLQVEDRMKSYLNYETNVDVELEYPENISFPVVTICNQNAFRLSQYKYHNAIGQAIMFTRCI